MLVFVCLCLYVHHMMVTDIYAKARPAGWYHLSSIYFTRGIMILYAVPCCQFVSWFRWPSCPEAGDVPSWQVHPLAAFATSTQLHTLLPVVSVCPVCPGESWLVSEVPLYQSSAQLSSEAAVNISYVRTQFKNTILIIHNCITHTQSERCVSTKSNQMYMHSTNIMAL